MKEHDSQLTERIKSPTGSYLLSGKGMHVPSIQRGPMFCTGGITTRRLVHTKKHFPIFSDRREDTLRVKDRKKNESSKARGGDS